MQNISKIILSIFMAVSLFSIAGTGLFVPQAHAQTKDWDGVCIYKGTDKEGAFEVATIQGFQCLIGNILQVAISGIGLAGFVMMIVGSFRYMMSAGNAKGIDGGRTTITYAVVGLLVALSSFIIIQLISNFTGVPALLEFKIPLGP